MYGKDYAYPQWGEMLGFMISLSSMVSLKLNIHANNFEKVPFVYIFIKKN